MFLNFLVYLSFLLFFDYGRCIYINLSSNEGAFMKYQNNTNLREIVFKQPLKYKLNMTMSIGNLKITKPYERSKYRATVFVDKNRIYLQSNLDSPNLIVNAICRFDHEQAIVYNFDSVCCQTTLLYRSKIVDRKLCKLDIGGTSSDCFLQLEASKKLFSSNYDDEYELVMRSRVFSSLNANCSKESDKDTPLAKGLPQKIIVTPGLRLEWNVSDLSPSFGKLEIGVPVDSLEIHSKTIFPIRILSSQPIQSVKIQCSYGSDIALSAIYFDGTKFAGEFRPKNRDGLVKIDVQRVNPVGSMNWKSLVGEHLGNLEIEVIRGTQSDLFSKWISCSVISAIFSNSKLQKSRIENEGASYKVEVNVNTGGFVIIPITEEKTYFSILSEIHGPIELQKTDLKMFFVLNPKDGAGVDVTDKIECNPNSKASIQCPLQPIKNKGRTSLKDPDWNILLKMKNWQRLITYPIELWRAEDWRMVIEDRTLNKIASWLYFDRNSQTCLPVHQVTRCHLIARLAKSYSDTKKLYFGQRESEEYPSFDFTAHLKSSNLHMSKQHIKATLKDDFVLLSAVSQGVSDITIVNNNGKKIGYDRVAVADKEVLITDLLVSCVYTINTTQSTDPYNPSFLSVIIGPQLSRSKEEHCYFRIEVVFSDFSRTDITDFSAFALKIVLQTPEKSETISDLGSFIYQPSNYKEPGRFSIRIYESDQCSKEKLLISKEVNLYNSKAISVDYSSTTPDSTYQTKRAQTEATTISVIKVDQKGLDTDSIFLSMKILIGLVALVVLMVILNCALKLRQRKSVQLLDHQQNLGQNYLQTEKLVSSTYMPVEQHPPLLPPPGPLYNASDSSQLDLTVNATPDIFWGLPQGHSHAYRDLLGPLPRTDCLDFSGTTPRNFSNDSESAATGSSMTMNVPPPCAPLRWTNNLCSNQFAMYYPCGTDLTTEPSHHSSQNSQSSSWEMSPKAALPPSNFSNLSDNGAEKSSGLGSLASTKPDSDSGKKGSPKPGNYSMSH